MTKKETITTSYEFSQDELLDAILMYLQTKEIRNVKKGDITFGYAAGMDHESREVDGFNVTVTQTNG